MRAIIGLLERIANALETLAGCELRKREMFKASGPEGDVPTKQEPKAKRGRKAGKSYGPYKKDGYIGIDTLEFKGYTQKEISTALKVLGVKNVGNGKHPRIAKDQVQKVKDCITVRRRLGL